jgi:uncharacterized protein YciI
MQAFLHLHLPCYHFLAMTKQHFFCRLIPPRPTFATDMNEQERAVMQQHVAYFTEHFNAGKVLIFGPVLSATGAFGMGVLEMTDESEVHQFFADDPSVKSGLNTYDVSPMRVGAARALGA